MNPPESWRRFETKADPGRQNTRWHCVVIRALRIDPVDLRYLVRSSLRSTSQMLARRPWLMPMAS
jgi:hypothetical protein